MNILRCAALSGEIALVGEQQLPVEPEIGDRIEAVRLGGLLGGGESDQRPDEADARLHFREQGEPRVEALRILLRVPSLRGVEWRKFLPAGILLKQGFRRLDEVDFADQVE